MDAPHRAGTPRRVTAAFSPDAVQAKLSRLRDLRADLEIVAGSVGPARRDYAEYVQAVARFLIAGRW